MANKNPIHLINDGPTEIFLIPKEFKDSKLYLTIKIELLDDGWQFYAWHSIFLKNKNIFLDNRAEPQKLLISKIGEEYTGKDLDGKILRIDSGITRKREGSETENPSRVKYTIVISSEDKDIDSFEFNCGNENPIDFISNIKFKQEV